MGNAAAMLFGIITRMVPGIDHIKIPVVHSHLKM